MRVAVAEGKTSVLVVGVVPVGGVVEVGIGVLVGSFGCFVAVAVLVGLGVLVGVAVGVFVGVLVGVLVGVGAAQSGLVCADSW
jgi:hypothetical protein